MGYLNIKDYNRPDEEALSRILKRNAGSCAELVIRLAWNAGMNLSEARELKWEQISFDENQPQITLPNRTIPLEGELLQCLQAWYERFYKKSPEYVVISDLRRVRVTRVALSGLVSNALKAGGLKDITMTDLRQDYVIRLMEQHDLPYVSRISGLKLSVLKQNYSQYISPTKKAEDEKVSASNLSEDQMISLVKSEGVPLGIAIWLSWKVEIGLEEIVRLTWDQIDLKMRILKLPSGYIFIDDTLDELLQKAQAIRDPEGDPHVLLTPKAKKAFAADRLSKVIRMVLIRWGLEDTLLVELKQAKKWKENEDRILRYVEEKKCITMNEVQEVLQVSEHSSYNCMQRIQAQGKLIRVGTRYYLPGTIVHPEQQYEAICAYLEDKGSAGLGELSQLLGIEYKQCLWILKGMVEEGRLLHKNRQYMLP